MFNLISQVRNKNNKKQVKSNILINKGQSKTFLLENYKYKYEIPVKVFANDLQKIGNFVYSDKGNCLFILEKKEYLKDLTILRSILNYFSYNLISEEYYNTYIKVETNLPFIYYQNPILLENKKSDEDKQRQEAE